jgi:hypothetical protein
LGRESNHSSLSNAEVNNTSIFYCLWLFNIVTYKGDLRRSRYSDWIRAGRLSPGRVKNFHYSTSSRPALGSTQPPIQWVLSPGVKLQGREAHTYLQLVSRSRKRGSIYTRLQGVVLKWLSTGTNLPFYKGNLQRGLSIQLLDLLPISGYIPEFALRNQEN